MTLAEYLEEPGRTANQLAEEVGCSPSTITRAAKGLTVPRPSLIRRICSATQGLVTPESYYGVAA